MRQSVGTQALAVTSTLQLERVVSALRGGFCSDLSLLLARGHLDHLRCQVISGLGPLTWRLALWLLTSHI